MSDLFSHLPPWIELVFFGGTALGIGIYQYWSVSREIERDKARKAEEEAQASAPGAGHAEGKHELDNR